MVVEEEEEKKKKKWQNRISTRDANAEKKQETRTSPRFANVESSWLFRWLFRWLLVVNATSQVSHFAASLLDVCMPLARTHTHRPRKEAVPVRSG